MGEFSLDLTSGVITNGDSDRNFRFDRLFDIIIDFRKLTNGILQKLVSIRFKHGKAKFDVPFKMAAIMTYFWISDSFCRFCMKLGSQMFSRSPIKMAKPNSISHSA